jgi:hypothetical protein
MPQIIAHYRPVGEAFGYSVVSELDADKRGVGNFYVAGYTRSAGHSKKGEEDDEKGYRLLCYRLKLLPSGDGVSVAQGSPVQP